MFDWSRQINNSGKVEAKTLTYAIAKYLTRECNFKIDILNDRQMMVYEGLESGLIIDIEQVLSLVNGSREYTRYQVIKQWIATWHKSKSSDVISVNKNNVIIMARPVNSLVQSQVNLNEAGLTLDKDNGFMVIDEHLSLIVCAKTGSDTLVGVTGQVNLKKWIDDAKANLSLEISNDFQMGLAKDNGKPFIVHFHTYDPNFFISIPLSDPHAGMIAEKLDCEISSLCFYFHLSEEIGLAIDENNEKAIEHMKKLAMSTSDEFRLYCVGENGLLKPYGKPIRLH